MEPPEIPGRFNHVFIQQAWSRGGLYDDVYANEGLRRIGNGLWNLVPVPARFNNWLGRPGNEIFAQVFATMWYSGIVFGVSHLDDLYTPADE